MTTDPVPPVPRTNTDPTELLIESIWDERYQSDMEFNAALDAVRVQLAAVTEPAWAKVTLALLRDIAEGAIAERDSLRVELAAVTERWNHELTEFFGVEEQWTADRVIDYVVSRDHQADAKRAAVEAECEKVNALLIAAGNHYPLGHTGVSDVINQREGHRLWALEERDRADSLRAQLAAVTTERDELKAKLAEDMPEIDRRIRARLETDRLIGTNPETTTKDGE